MGHRDYQSAIVVRVARISAFALRLWMANSAALVIAVFLDGDPETGHINGQRHCQTWPSRALNGALCNHLLYLPKSSVNETVAAATTVRLQPPTPPPRIIGERSCGSYNHCTTSCAGVATCCVCQSIDFPMGSFRTTTLRMETSHRRSNNDLEGNFESHYQQTQLRWPHFPTNHPPLDSPLTVLDLCTNLSAPACNAQLPSFPHPKSSVNETAAATTTVRRVRGYYS
ncbi:hypothetical protein T265_10706 [Opisthorchis viverrini]|uniref:Uncharacterized protein n=1 Tax=Opisthorchis viverrini TaxID=6198 RepID=A0A074Z5M4_OPIVI|nr:hypothetical protein T265_10706 [Opisthorchis viverrini]KER20832.1 hypothetical protein T265_10706 [Opisthorchis viverrini]